MNVIFLLEQLVDLGIEVYYQIVVGDNQQCLEELIVLVEIRSEFIFLCGGLGLIEDDLIKEVIVVYFGKFFI